MLSTTGSGGDPAPEGWRWAVDPNDGGRCLELVQTAPVKSPTAGRGTPGTVLKALLREQHMSSHPDFIRAYEKAAGELDRSLVGYGPSKAQYYKWLAGAIKGDLPRGHHCQVLEAMLPGWTAEQLFSPADEQRPTRTPQAPATVDKSPSRPSRVDYSNHNPRTGARMQESADARAGGATVHELTGTERDPQLLKAVHELPDTEHEPQGAIGEARMRELMSWIPGSEKRSALADYRPGRALAGLGNDREGVER
jgi:hypothetical protein